MHEKLVLTLRDMKIMNRRIKYADSINDRRLKRMRLNKYPELKLDHVVRERYPTFVDAIKDMDDCMTLLFLFSTFPALKAVSRSQTAFCRRLSIEFMHYVIAAKALRKVFVSIKGYYFQADIKGQLITWIVPHYYPYQPQAKSEVDFRIMTIFVEFYTIMCGFVNFRLFHSLNIQYPPQFNVSLDSEESQVNEDVFVSERIAALNLDLARTSVEETEEPEEMDLQLIASEGDSEKVRKMHEREQDLKRLKNLFKGIKIFINREVPREPLVFIIRCFGGKVSWDKNCFIGATFDEDDETITHQIVDRPSISKQYISRDYVQPQWIFDSVNQSRLLPTNKYFLGVTLPPHLSPFVDPDREEVDYVPPEERALHDPNVIVTHDLEVPDETARNEQELDAALVKAFRNEKKEIKQKQIELKEPQLPSDDDEEVDMADMLGNSASEDEADAQVKVGEKKQKKVVELTKEQKREAEKKKMAVASGKVFKIDNKKEKRLTEQELKLRAKMVKSRHKRLYHKLLDQRDKSSKEMKLLEQKRKQIDNKRKQSIKKAAKT